MQTPFRHAAAAILFGVLTACTQPGGDMVRPEQQPAGAPGCAAGEHCPYSPTQYRYVPPVPAAPVVPDSPLKTDCAQLPNQVERDTCVNRKLTTT